MRFSELLEALPAASAPLRRGGGDPIVRGISYDSRQISSGHLFVALVGRDADGHRFIDEARRLGAVACLLENAEAAPADLAWAVVPNTRRALAPLAAHFYGSPAEELHLLGVTGTNGKTSTSFLLESILQAAGRRTGLIGTVEVRYGDERRRAVNTTPESLDLQRTLRAMVTHGIDAVVMEVSSHGLALGRVEGCRFDVGAVTNVTQDHLDFHESMEGYAEAKTLLFRRHLAPEGKAVVLIDDHHAPLFLAAADEVGAQIVRVSREHREEADVRVAEAIVALTGTRVRLELPEGPLEVELPLVGDFNVENLAVAAGMAVALGLPGATIAEGAARCRQVPGRVERIEGPPGSPTVIVDYAHTPDAIHKLLRTLHPLVRGRMITVFGCGGDRDLTKRAPMAEAVALFSDRAIATSDNPRTEDPERILRDVERGLGGLRRSEPDALDDTEKGYCVITDRREAIARALAIAGPEDMVVLAGKGHEDYQIIGTTRLPFDDREEARRALEGRGA